MQNNSSFLAMIEQPCMISRLTDELREALSEFREDPMAFVRSALKRDARGSRRKMLLQVGLAAQNSRARQRSVPDYRVETARLFAENRDSGRR